MSKAREFKNAISIDFTDEHFKKIKYISGYLNISYTSVIRQLMFSDNSLDKWYCEILIREAKFNVTEKI